MIARKRKSQKGQIVVPSGVNIWPHELQTAKALAAVFDEVKFIRKSNREREHTADCYLDGALWELKSPDVNHTKSICRNLKRARSQSHKIVIDSCRIKHVPDKAILREVKTQTAKINDLDRVIYVNKKRQVVFIK